MRIPTVAFNCRSLLLFLPGFPWHQQCADFTPCQRHLQHALKYLYNGGMCTWRWRVSCIQTFVVDPADQVRKDHGVNEFLENYLSTKLHCHHIDNKSCSLVSSDYLLLAILIIHNPLLILVNLGCKSDGFYDRCLILVDKPNTRGYGTTSGVWHFQQSFVEKFWCNIFSWIFDGRHALPIT